jgi:hypothetical protein
VWHLAIIRYFLCTGSCIPAASAIKRSSQITGPPVM